jgi:hypothetical protein
MQFAINDESLADGIYPQLAEPLSGLASCLVTEFQSGSVDLNAHTQGSQTVFDVAKALKKEPGEVVLALKQHHVVIYSRISAIS